MLKTISMQIPDPIWFFIFCGTLLSLFIYITFLYFFTKKSEYILFAIYILALGLWLNSSYEYILYFSISNSYISMMLDILLFFISFSTLILFSIKFLNLHSSHPQIFKLSIWVCIIGTILFAIDSIVSINTFLNPVIVMFMILFNIYLGTLSLLTKYSPAKFYLIAMGGYFLGIILSFLSGYNLINSNSFTINAQIIGSIWQIVFLSIALAYKIKLLLNKKNQILLQNEIQEKMLFLQSHYASIGELVGNITHQWREPIAEMGAIQTNLEASLLLQGGVSNEKLTSSIKQNNEILKHLSETIDTFYSFFKHRRVQKEEFNIVEEIYNLQKMTYYALKVEQIILKYDCYNTLNILGNKSEFSNAILNIILNAKDVLVTRKILNPCIEIETYLKNETIIITIKDNAGGIRQQPLEKIFESGVSSKQNSIGLGLYITKTIIEQKMGGKITTQNIDDGTLFTIILPIQSNNILHQTRNENYNLEESTLQRVSRLEQELAKQTEIEKALNQWEEVFNQAHWAIALHKGESLKFEMVNPTFLKMYGYTQEEIKQIDVTNIIAPESLDILDQNMKKAFEKSFFSTEILHIKKDGTKFPANVDLTVIKNENDEILYYIANIRDISVQKEAQQEILLKTFALEHIHEGIFLIDKNGKFQYVNDGACKSLDYTKGELLSLGVGDIDPDWPYKRWGEHWEILKQRKNYSTEVRHKKKDGTLIPVEIESNYFVYEGEEYNLALGKNISEKKEIEKRKEDEKMRLFFERQPIGMAITSPEKKWLHINEKLSLMLGYTFDELHNLTWDEITHPDDIDKSIASFNKMLSGSLNDYIMEKRFIRKDGNIVFTNLSISCVRDDSNNVNYILGLFEDITERKKAEDKIKKLNATLEQKVFERTKELEDKERELRTVMENIPDFIARYDKNCRRIYVNKAVSDYFGVSAQELIGTSLEEKPLFGVPKEFTESLKYVLQTGKTIDIEAYNDFYSEQKWWNIIFTPELDENDNVENVLTIAHDITYIKKAEIEIKEREEKFSQLFKSSPAAVSLSSLDRNIYLEINDSFLIYTKYTKEEVIGKGATELNIFANPNDRERYLEELLKDSYIRDFEFEYQTKDGTTGYAIAYASTIDIKGERCVLTHSYPINARKQLELITTAINSASEAIYIVASFTQMIIYVNDAACDMLGYTKEELLCMKVRDIEANYSDADIQNFENQANQGDKLTIETQHRRKDKTILDVEVKISAFQFNGKDVGISVVKDITDIKKTRLALQKKQKEFTAQLEQKV